MDDFRCCVRDSAQILIVWQLRMTKHLLRGLHCSSECDYRNINFQSFRLQLCAVQCNVDLIAYLFCCSLLPPRGEDDANSQTTFESLSFNERTIKAMLAVQKQLYTRSFQRNFLPGTSLLCALVLPHTHNGPSDWRCDYAQLGCSASNKT
jgi:hypothetical protein